MIFCVSLVLMIAMAFMTWLLVAVGHSVITGGHGVMGQGSGRGVGHGWASPTEEETQQYSR